MQTHPLELSTLIALVVYGAIGWLLAPTAWLMLGESRPISVASSTTQQTRVG